MNLFSSLFGLLRPFLFLFLFLALPASASTVDFCFEASGVVVVEDADTQRVKELAAHLEPESIEQIATILNRELGRVIPIMARKLGELDPETQGEVRQEIMLSFLRKPDSFIPDGRASLSTFLSAIARNRILMFHRSKDRRRNHERNFTSLTKKEDFSPWDHLYAAIEPPEKSMERAEAVDQAKAALKNLSPDEQQAIELYYLQGMTHGEIGKRLKAKESTIKMRVLRGLQKLRALLS